MKELESRAERAKTAGGTSARIVRSQSIVDEDGNVVHVVEQASRNGTASVVINGNNSNVQAGRHMSQQQQEAMLKYEKRIFKKDTTDYQVFGHTCS